MGGILGRSGGWGFSQEAAEGTLLQNVNLQMAREEYVLNGQQGLDELLSVFAGDEDQVGHFYKFHCSHLCHALENGMLYVSSCRSPCLPLMITACTGRHCRHGAIDKL